MVVIVWDEDWVVVEFVVIVWFMGDCVGLFIVYDNFVGF